jgi:hypothetical protein
MTESVAVLGYGAFVPGYGGASNWASGMASDEFAAPTAEIVPKRQRRRASILSKALADAYAEALQSTSIEPATVASVFGSAIGEATTMVGLLDQMWNEAAMFSPMKFATSVHNAASGMVSIATENRGITTAIGADYDTPAMALLEGIGLVLSRNESVVVCCGDEAPPQDLVENGAGWSLIASAIALGPASEAQQATPLLSQLSIAPGSLAPPEIDAPADLLDIIGRNPNAGLLDLVVALHRGQQGILRLDRGLGRGFSVHLGAGA